MREDEQAIRAVVHRWMAATRAGDLDTLVDLMTDDVVFLTPGQDPFGKQAFIEASQANSEMEIDGRAEVLEVQVIGDRAILRNHLEVSMRTGPHDAPVRRRGHTLSVLEKGADGKWRIARDANLLAPVDPDETRGEEAAR